MGRGRVMVVVALETGLHDVCAGYFGRSDAGLLVGRRGGAMAGELVATVPYPRAWDSRGLPLFSSDRTTHLSAETKVLT